MSKQIMSLQFIGSILFDILQVIDSDHTDSCSVSCVNGKCNVLTLEEYEAQSSGPANEPATKKKKADGAETKNQSSEIPVLYWRREGARWAGRCIQLKRVYLDKRDREKEGGIYIYIYI